jgi:excisionase family DNA binding protein
MNTSASEYVPFDGGKIDKLITGFAGFGPVLTATEVADLLSLSVQEVRRLTRNGNLPARRIGKAYRYFRDEIVIWLDSQVTE